MTNFLAPSDMYSMGAQQAAGVGMVPSVAPVGGQSVYPPQFQTFGAPQGGFNYAAPRSGIGFMPAGMAGSTATGGIGMMGAAPGAIGTVAGVASLFSASPMLAGLGMLDASGIGAAMSIGGAGLTGGMGAAAMAAPPALAGMAVAGAGMYGGAQIARGGQEYNQIGAQLSGYNFANPFAASGRGFGYGQQAQITNMMREFESADPFTSMRDLNRLMDNFNEMEIAQGVRNAKEFATKFTKFADAVRDIATEMGTTLDEAGRLFGQMRQTGFYTSADVTGNTRRMQVSSSLGMSSGAFLGMQSSAAQTARQAQMSGRAGALTSARFSQDLLLGATSRSSGGLGLYSPEELMDITGASTQGEAAAAMGTQFTGLMTQYLRGSAAGKAMLAGVGTQSGGRFTGGVDEGLLGRISSGNVGLDQLSRMAGPRMRSGRQQTSFVTHEAGIASSLLESEQGIDAVYTNIEKTAKSWAGDRGIGAEDAVRLFLQEVVRADELTAEKFAEVMSHRKENRDKIYRLMRREQQAAAMRLDMARNRTFSGLTTRITGTLDDYVSAPIREVGTDVAAYVDESVLGVQDSVFGVSRGDTTAQQMRSYAMDVATGRDVGRFSGVSASDMDRRTASGFMAERRGADSVLSMRRRLIAGGSLSDEDFGFSGDMLSTYRRNIQGGQLQSGALVKAQKDKILRVTSRYAAAQARNDSAGMAAARKELTDLVKGLGPGQMAREGGLKRIAAFAANEVGAEGMARSLMLEGDAPSSAYRDVSEVRAEAYEAAKAAGLDNAMAKSMSSGGAGASVLAYASLGDQQMKDVEKFLTTGLSGDFETDAAKLSAMTGREFAADDIDAAQKIFVEGGVTSETGWSRLGNLASSAAGTVLTPGGLLWAGAEGSSAREFLNTSSDILSGAPLQSRRGKLRQMARTIGGAQSTVAGASSREAIQANLARASEELKAAIGGELFGQLSSGVDQKGLASLRRKVESGVFEGLPGGEKLDSIRIRMERALSSNEELKEMYGLTEKQALSMGTGRGLFEDDDGRLSAEERRKLVEALGSADIYENLSSSAGGGVFLSGQSAESRLAYQMGLTADKVQKMAESVEKVAVVVNEMNEPTSWFGGASKTAEEK